MQRIAVVPTQRTNVRTRAFREVATPWWPFRTGGLVPLVLLMATSLFGSTRFANAWIERTADENIRGALHAAEHSWAELQVSGQMAQLSGAPPSTPAGEDALSVAREARCPTWLGPRVCAVSVVAAFSGEGSTVAWPDLVAAVNERILTLRGEVPDARSRDAVVNAAQRTVGSSTISSVVDQLTIAGTAAPAAFGVLAQRAVDVASRCQSGRVALTEGRLSVRCQVARVTEGPIRALLQSPPSAGVLGQVDLVVAENVAACEARLASELSHAGIEFATGSAAIVPAAAGLLDRVASAASGCPGILRIEGHTDSTGNRDANQALSQARAQAVRQALGERGVPVDRLIAVGLGQSEPIASNATSEGRSRNRRIKFRVTLGSS